MLGLFTETIGPEDHVGRSESQRPTLYTQRRLSFQALRAEVRQCKAQACIVCIPEKKSAPAE
ncbi:hypothetical protein PCAR4_570097 [Paraburkholderia caribensis]|nr:hypothetical protein PCAR4_570097 [Paraburkholderia caribensis]